MTDQLRLLLAEDEPNLRELLEELLRRAGYLVDTVCDGHEALQRISTGQYHMLLTDRDMPGIDGATLCRRVRAANLPNYVYILLLTGYGSEEDVVLGLESGADDYIRKPANDAELLARLNAGRRVILLEQSLREANAQIQLLSVTDPLVGTYNRRYLNEHLVQEVERARRYSRSLTAVMADLDHFKAINDSCGHQTGDEVLKCFAQVVKSSVRQSIDWVARYGGEEFVIVLPETDLSGAAAMAEKIRSLWAATPVPTRSGELLVTASFGVAALASLPEPSDAAAEALLRAADEALYFSKRSGRNRVTAAR